jgi:hypothetical protein
VRFSLEQRLNIDGSVSFRRLRNFHEESPAGTPQPWLPLTRLFPDAISEEVSMKKTLAVLATVAAVSTAAVVAPSPAEARGIGPGLAFGLAAGAITAGALAATSPYYYGPYGYYGPPAYYAYGPGPYAYYGGPVYHPYYHRWHRWYR